MIKFTVNCEPFHNRTLSLSSRSGEKSLSSLGLQCVFLLVQLVEKVHTYMLCVLCQVMYTSTSLVNDLLSIVEEEEERW